MVKYVDVELPLLENLSYQIDASCLVSGFAYFMMAMQMLIKMRQIIFLHMNTFVLCHRNRKLNYFHFTNINDISFL